MNEEIEVYDLDGEIEDTGYYLADEGVHTFTVVGIEKKKYEPKPGSKSKLPSCWQVVVTCSLDDTPESVVVSSNLYLTSKTKGLLVRFFESIGVLQKGEKLKMQWNIIGKSGYLELDHREYNGNEYNNIKAFLTPTDKKVAAYEAKSSATASASNAWKAGTF